MKRIINLAVLAMIMLPICSVKTNAMTPVPPRPIVVYFSHAGENYSVGNIQVGNTRLVAEQIAGLTSADLFEITTDKYDGMSYKKVCDVAQDEQIQDARPPFKPIYTAYRADEQDKPIEENFFDTYRVVFIGGPVWWGTWPQVMFTFFDTYDLNRLILIPFTTHEGSGLGSCVQDLKASYPQANVEKGFSIYGHEVRTEAGKQKIEKWIHSLGF